MNHNQFLLLGTRRFLPLFITQFLGAFHDNVFKNAFVVLLLFDATAQPENAMILTTLAAGIFILPFVVFSALGGQIADKFPKQKVILAIKLAEILIALLGAVSLYQGSVLLSFMTLFALGTHSAFFSPSKYSILPQHLEVPELMGGNALVNTGTFLAILFGTIAGTILITLPSGRMIISAIMIGAAIAGSISAYFILVAPPKATDLKLNFNPLTETLDILSLTFSQESRIVRCILGIAWFWFMGAMFMAQLPNFTQNIIGANEHVLSFFLVLFSIGIAVGGLLNNRLLKGRVEVVYVPLAMLGITAFSVDLYYAGIPVHEASASLQNFKTFIGLGHNWRIAFDIVLIAICGGLFVVPLIAMLQHLAPEKIRARILAGSTVMNALLMVTSSAFSAILIGMNFTILQLFLTFAIINALVAVYLCGFLFDYLNSQRR